MIGSTRGLLALAVLAVLAILLAALDAPAPAVEHRLVPGLDVAAITELDGRGFALEKAGDHFAWRAPAGEADRDAVDRMLTALRGARWQRRGGDAGAARGELVIRTATERHELRLGQPIAGAEQVWLTVDGEPLLVDRWVEEALFPAPVALRLRHPLEGALAKPVRIAAIDDRPGSAAGAIELSGTALKAGDRALRIAPELRARLETALANVEIVALPPPASPPAPAAPLEIQTATSTVREAGSCGDGLVLVAATTGNGCVRAAAWAEVAAVVAQLRGPAEAIVDRRPFAGAKHMVLADGTAVDLVKIGQALDPVRVGELAAALAAPAEIASAPAKPTGVLEVDGARLDLFDDGSVARAGEPVRLLPDPDARAVLRRTGEAIRDPRLWAEEPTTIAAIEIDGKTFARGASLGEWRTGDAKTLDALALALATPISLGGAPALASRAHLVAIQIRRPDGGEAHHELALSRDCRATAEGRTVKLAGELCALVDRLH